MKIKRLLISMTAAFALSSAHTVWTDAPKYIFYFIGDGMGMGPATAAEMYNRQVKGNTTPITMMQFPIASMCLTYSANSPVTDSAAAGTAIASGVKTNNGMLGVTPDSAAVNSIARFLKDKGYGVGIVTSVAPDDATPGAYFAHVPHRSMFYEIGVQAALSDFDFIAGAGLRGEYDKNGNPTDLLEVMEKYNMDVVRGTDQLAESTSERIFLLNNPDTPSGNIGYTIDSLQNVLTLPVITQSCLNHLVKYSPDKFFIMVEGGNIDHALHANDGGAAIKEVLNFNEAIDIAMDFYEKYPDETLIIVTADHDTGGMTIGSPFTGYDAHLEKIDWQKISKEEFNNYCKGILKSRRIYTWDDMKEYLTEKFGFYTQIKLTEPQDKALQDKFEATFSLRNSEDQKTLYANFNSFATEVFKIFNDHAGIGFVTTHHTGNPVPLFAIGADASRFSHLNNNSEITPTVISLFTK